MVGYVSMGTGRAQFACEISCFFFVRRGFFFGNRFLGSFRESWDRPDKDADSVRGRFFLDEEIDLPLDQEIKVTGPNSTVAFRS